jgi:hypothetical protein
MAENLREIISTDPFSVKKNIVQLAKKRLGAKNPDAFESGFLGYEIQLDTMLMSDAMFNNALSFNEAFTTQAILPGSVSNLAAMFDYELGKPTPPKGKMLIGLPYPNVESLHRVITIPHGTRCDSDGNIHYRIVGDYTASISVSKTDIRRSDPFTGTDSFIPFNVEIRDGRRYILFFVDIWQVRIFEYDFSFDDTKLHRFIDIPISGLVDQFFDMYVGAYIREENESVNRLIQFKQVASMYTCTAEDRAFSFSLGNSGSGTIRFGNGIFGYQPEKGTSGHALIYTTMGAAGNVVAKSLTLNIQMMDVQNNVPVPYFAYNSTEITNGRDTESLPVAKRRIIESISAAKRLVTAGDYRGYEGVTTIRNLTMRPLLLRRDNVNEIDTFVVLYDRDGKPIPTTCYDYFPTPLEFESGIIDKEHVYYLAYKDMGYLDLYPRDTPPPVEERKVNDLFLIGENPQGDWAIVAPEDPIANRAGMLARWIRNPENLSVCMWEYSYHYNRKKLYPQNTPPDESTLREGDVFFMGDAPTGEWSHLSTNVHKFAIWKKKSATTYGWEYVAPHDDEVYRYKCPFNISIADVGDKRAQYEYLLGFLSRIPVVRNQMQAINIEIGLQQAYLQTVPSPNTAVTASSPEYINFVQIFTYTAAVEVGQMEIMMNIIPTYPAKESVTACQSTQSYYPVYKQNQDDASSNFIATIRKENIPMFGFRVQYVVRYLGQEYNTYTTKSINIYTLADEDNDGTPDTVVSMLPIDEIHGMTLDVSASSSRPSIEKVDLSLSKVDLGWSPWTERVIVDPLDPSVTEDQIISGFQLNVHVTKLDTMKSGSDVLECRLFIDDREVPLYDPIQQPDVIFNNPGVDTLNTTLIYNYRIRNSDPIIGRGPTTYTIKLYYKFSSHDEKTLYAEYSDTVIFKSMMNELAWSNVLRDKNPDTNEDALKVFRIPVVEATYYDTNRSRLDDIIFYEMAQLNDYFLKYRMLSDQVNMKFARTHGVIENLKYNDNIVDRNRYIMPYGGWSCDLPPTIKLKAYIKRSSKLTAQEIVNEIKQVLLAFLQVRAGFNGSIIRSEISRFLHDTISDLTSVEVLEPTRDIIYLFDPEYHLPKDRNIVMAYVPEFLWIDTSKIFVQVVILP